MGNFTDFEDGLYERAMQVGDAESLATKSSKVSIVTNLEDQRSLVKEHLDALMASKLKAAESSEDLLGLADKLSQLLGTPPLELTNGAPSELRWVSQRPAEDQDRFENQRPLTPLAELALFTNARDEPRIDLELERELATADSVDILVSFIKMSGLRLLEAQLRKMRDRGVPVRLITTTYIGATDKKAVDRLVNELGVRVRIDLLPNSNRLHAKAWLFNRRSGFSTAFIGSSNMSQSALTSGSEWNVRLAQTQAPALFDKFRASFETYWESDDYKEYSTETLGDALEEALARQSKQGPSDPYLLSNLEVTARPHQLKMLEELRVAREVFGHSRNLVVAATGTGKTVLAALDYKRLIESGKPRPRLLFVAHRKEILTQAMSTFRQVLGDSSFGELLVDGNKPKEWMHVFASIQSLAAEGLDGLAMRNFQHLIIDEFHHAEAKSYKKLFSQTNPDQVVGLTATPERTDGLDLVWREEFGGRIASELRLWDALGQDLLAPFHYFGIGEDLDFSSVPWATGRYEAQAVSNLITSNTFRNKRVLRELNSKLPDLTKMRALVFCVSVDHANQVASDFSREGVITKAVTATTQNRGAIIQELRQGLIQAIATVDVFNEGVDIPEVDTIVLLRPTESPTVFLQQIGRGLRRAPDKDQVLILDFIGAHRAEYRIDKKFEALSGKPRSEVLSHLENGFPFLPSGSAIQLDELSQKFVLDLMKRQIGPSWQKLVAEVKSYGTTSLFDYLDKSGRDLFEVYRGSNKNWSYALAEAGLLVNDLSMSDGPLLSKLQRLLHVDDILRLEGFERLLADDSQTWSSLSDMDKRLASMLFWNLFEDGKNPVDGSAWTGIDEAFQVLRLSAAFLGEARELFSVLKNRITQVGETFGLRCGSHPLLAHATYTRYELLGALGYGRLPGSSVYEDGATRSIAGAREGVYFVPEAEVDLFLVTLQKSEKLSPSIRYHDYAISPNLFHWESQSRTRPESPTGQRYIKQSPETTDVLIAVRETSDGPNGTRHFKLLGPADYVKHEGSQPIAIWWHLRVPMDPDSFEIAAAAKVS